MPIEEPEGYCIILRRSLTRVVGSQVMRRVIGVCTQVCRPAGGGGGALTARSTTCSLAT